MVDRMSGAPYLRAGILRSFQQFLRQYPRDLADRILQRTGVGPMELANADARIRYDAATEALEMGAIQGGDDMFGLRFGQQLAWEDLGLLAEVLGNSATIGDALENVTRYLALQQTAGRPRLDISDGTARLVYSLDLTDIGSHTQEIEHVLAATVRLCRELSGHPAWAPTAVHLQRRRHVSPATVRQFFGCPVLYDEPVNALVMRAADLRTVFPSANPALLHVLRRTADERLANVHVAEDFADEVTRIVMSSLCSGNATVEYVARCLSSTPRTLQRRLQQNRVSFRDLLAQARLALAYQYVSDPSRSLTDIALLLGYSDLSAFSRAFRRWMGQCPIEFRRDRFG